MHRKEKSLCHSLGRPSRSDFVQFQFEEKNRKYASVNSYRSILRCYFNQFLDVNIKVPDVPKRQEEVIPLAKAEEALTYQEYLRLVRTAEKYEKKRIAMIIQAMAAIGLKVSELKYLTKDALRERLVPVTRNHKKMYCPISESVAAGFEKYIEEENIKNDIILCTSKGTVVERANIWRDLKLLCLLANVPQEKVSAEKLRETFELNFIHSKN